MPVLLCINDAITITTILLDSLHQTDHDIYSRKSIIKLQEH